MLAEASVLVNTPRTGHKLGCLLKTWRRKTQELIGSNTFRPLCCNVCSKWQIISKALEFVTFCSMLKLLSVAVDPPERNGATELRREPGATCPSPCINPAHSTLHFRLVQSVLHVLYCCVRTAVTRWYVPKHRERLKKTPAMETRREVMCKGFLVNLTISLRMHTRGAIRQAG
jgi:hypothetical protein